MTAAVRTRPVLVVDDDPSILSMVAEALDFEGFPVATASNGAEALHAVDAEHPVLVLLDMRMPVMDGWGFANALEEQGKRVPIVVMTAAQDARRWAGEIGAAGFLAKPFDLDQLINTVEQLYRGIVL